MKRIMKGIVLLGLLLNGAFAHSQTITTIAGTGRSGHTGDGGAATSARITPANCLFDDYGNFFFVGGISNSSIRMIDRGGIIHTIAGQPTAGYSGDGGPATLAKMNHPHGIAIDSGGNIFVADRDNYRIRKIDSYTGLISTIAGNGIPSVTGDGGPATLASVMPIGICIDRVGNIYLIDGNGAKVRKINPSGTITTIAGTGIGGFSGDGGHATAAMLAMNYGICTDTLNNVYVSADTRVRKIDIGTGIISTIAGTGFFLYSGEGGPATAASFNAFTLGFDKVRNELYISDSQNDRIYNIDAAGIFHLIAGKGTQGFSGDGFEAKLAELFNPEGTAIDHCGNIYISDFANYRIRKVTFNPKTTPTVSISGITSAAVGSPVTVSAAVSGAGSSYSIRWLNRGVEFATTTVPMVSYTKALGTDTITARVVPVVSYCYDSATSAAHIVNTSTAGLWGGSGIAASIYPNPAGNTLTVSAPRLSGISITNLLGQVVLAVACGSDEVHLDIAGLPAGVYVVRVTDANGAVAVRRVVKE